MLKFDETLQLFINGDEYDFDNKISFQFHPTNFSTMTFNEVIAKKDNTFPYNFNKQVNINREFTFAEVKQNNQTIFFGIINDTGRYSLLPETPKTFSVVITDFRKFLSSTNPINKIWKNKTPNEIVNDVVAFLNEPRIKVGTLNFSNNEPIKTYSSINKNAYQILKNVITKLSNSFLYFTIENDKILINYKSEFDMQQISPIKIEPANKNFTKKYGILDIVFENETFDYANFLTYTSENIIPTFPNVEFNIPITENIYLKNNPTIIESNIAKTFITEANGKTRRAIFINEKKYIQGKVYDFLYSPDNNVLKAHERNLGLKLTITYFSKTKISFQDKNQKEIDEIARISKTNGIIAQYDKYNDLSYSTDLLRQLKSDLNQFSSPNKKLTITSEEPIWDLTEAVEVVANNKSIDGIYLVHSISSDQHIVGNFSKNVYNYELKQTKNFDNIINKFDNQSYRDEAIFDDESYVEETLTLFQYIDLKTKFTLLEADTIQYNTFPLNTKLNYLFYKPSKIKPKFKQWKVDR